MAHLLPGGDGGGWRVGQRAGRRGGAHAGARRVPIPSDIVDFLRQDGQVFSQVLTEPAGETQTHDHHRDVSDITLPWHTCQHVTTCDSAFTLQSQRCAWTSSGTGQRRSDPHPPPFPGRQTWSWWRASGGCVASGQRWKDGKSVWLWRYRHSSRILHQRKKRSPSPSVCDGNLRTAGREKPQTSTTGFCLTRGSDKSQP